MCSQACRRLLEFFNYSKRPPRGTEESNEIQLRRKRLIRWNVRTVNQGISMERRYTGGNTSHAVECFIKNNRRDARRFDRSAGRTFNQLSVKIINGKLLTIETFRARRKQAGHVFFPDFCSVFFSENNHSEKFRRIFGARSDHVTIDNVCSSLGIISRELRTPGGSSRRNIGNSSRLAG